MIVTISGLPGSGTSTVAKILSERTGYSILSAGDTFRLMASERGMSLAEFGALAEEDSSIDVELDKRMTAEARAADELVLEGRLAGWNCILGEVDALKVWVDASLEERARRVVEREGKPLQQVMDEMTEREQCEWVRYKEFYDIDLRDTGVYDLVIDSTTVPAAGVAGMIFDRMGGNRSVRY